MKTIENKKNKNKNYQNIGLDQRQMSSMGKCISIAGDSLGSGPSITELKLERKNTESRNALCFLCFYMDTMKYTGDVLILAIT